MNHRPRILVVDDTMSNIKLLNALLRQDYNISVAANGPDALEVAESQNQPDLILLDIMMPVMDGYEVCRRLKANKKMRDIPVIFITAKNGIDDERQGLDLGAVDFITKPISPPIVKARVRNHLLLKQQHDQLKKSISMMRHEAEILQHKAELGIQAGGLAHDINNLLAAAMVAECIPKALPKHFPQKDQVMEDIGQILDVIQSGRELCQGFTNYLHDIGAEFIEQPVPPLLQPLDMYARRFSGTLERDIAGDVPPIHCKGYQLKRVVVNLFVNAMQAIEKQAEQRIAIRLRHDNGQVILSIHDNGPGIAQEILPRIFDERFTTKPDGTGLGLFLVKQIVDAHKGTIAVRSGRDEGTTFTLSFPAC